jgi:outer membrane lipoprotein-sorting protein
MRRSFSRIAAISLALVLSAGAAHAQTADEIVARNVKAKGGLDKLKSVSSVKMVGKMTSQGNTLSLTVWSRRPNLFRREIDVQGQKMVQVSDGSKVWILNPMMGADPQELSSAQADVMLADADFDGVLTNYKERGTAIELVGTEQLGGKEVYHLKVTPRGGQLQHYYIDTATGLEVKVARRVEQGGMTMNVETELSNYQDVDGLMVPFTTRQLLNGTPAAEVTIEKVEFNAPMEDSLFKMPAKR